LRSRRALFTAWVLGVSAACLLLFFGSEQRRFRWSSPGPLSSVHAQPKGGRGQVVGASTENCAACHRSAGAGLRGWVQAAAGADPHPFHFAGFVRHSDEKITRMDKTCAECHGGHQFHHVNMQQEQSCLKCHTEHQGDAGLRLRTAQQCIECHADSHRMDAAIGREFSVVLRGGTDAPPVRPAINGLRRGHPEFTPLRTKMADPNTLRFNHQLHLAAPVAGADGKPLSCSACHQDDAAGEYQQRIRFERHCQSCHSLQFDPETPELQLPHGDVEHVKAFLASLPSQYEEHARKIRGITERRALQAFVASQMKRLEERKIGGADLAEEIFLSRTRQLQASGRTSFFYGCAYCHEISGRGADLEVVKAELPARWLTKGAFHHREHQHVSCTTCHQAAESSRTSDILLPSVKTCAACHRPNSVPGESCTLCHSYHNSKERLEAGVAGELGVR
jgi:hypothetical protein